MHELNGTIHQVMGHTAGTGKAFWKVSFSDGNDWSTFEGEMAQKAAGLVGQPVTLRVEMKPKQNGGGQWLNLVDVFPQGQAPALATPAAPGTALPAGTPVAQANGAANIPMAPPPEPEAEKNMRITFLAAAKTAATLVGPIYAGSGAEGIQEAVTHWKNLTNDLMLKALKKQPKAAPVTPEQIAEAVPNVQVGVQETQADEDIPNW